MAANLKFIGRFDTLFPYCYLAVEEHFESIAELKSWFDALESDTKRNVFLKVASYYVALVKKGDWHVDTEEMKGVIEYFTNTFKYIAIMSLIESLTDTKHIDFFQYLIQKQSKTEFPITKDGLEGKYREYKDEHGSIQQCIGFFKALPGARQRDLIGKLEALDIEPTIENFVRYLYQLRSEFVHEAELIHELSNTSTFSNFGNKVLLCNLNIKDAMEFFEEGLIIWCESS